MLSRSVSKRRLLQVLAALVGSGWEMAGSASRNSPHVPTLSLTLAKLDEILAQIRGAQQMNPDAMSIMSCQHGCKFFIVAFFQTLSIKRLQTTSYFISSLIDKLENISNALQKDSLSAIFFSFFILLWINCLVLSFIWLIFYFKSQIQLI